MKLRGWPDLQTNALSEFKYAPITSLNRLLSTSDKRHNSLLEN